MIIPPLFTIIPPLLSVLFALSASAKEFPMENTDAYSSAYKVNPGCMLPTCVSEPTQTFKAKYNCPPGDPAECLCGNVTRSVELRASMMTACSLKCDPTLMPVATPVFEEYCSRNGFVDGEPIITPAPTSGPNMTPPSTLQTRTSGPSSTGATDSPSPTNPPQQEEKISPRLQIGLGAGIPGAALLVGILAFLLSLYTRFRPRSRVAVLLDSLLHRGDSAKGSKTVQVDDSVTVAANPANGSANSRDVPLQDMNRP